MYKLWLSLTTMIVATAVQSLQVAMAANQNLPLVAPLAITELDGLGVSRWPVQRSVASLSDALQQSLDQPTAVVIPAVQPLPVLESSAVTSLDAPAAPLLVTPSPVTYDAVPVSVTPASLDVDRLPVPAVAPLPVLTSLEIDPTASILATKERPIKSPPKINIPITAKPLPGAGVAAPNSLELESATSPLEKTNILATQTGEASWYGNEGGPLTATGERYDPAGLSAAHRTLPFGSKVQVTNLRSNQSVIVRINDRGPFTGGRIIDLSAAAAAEVGIKGSGVGKVRVDVLSYGEGRKRARR
jgi:rare lipoprotein A